MGAELVRDFRAADVAFDEISKGFRSVDPDFDIAAIIADAGATMSTDLCQAAVFTHSALAWAAFGSELKSSTAHLEFVAALGHSFGELTAHVVAGTLGLGRMAALVLQRGQLMSEAPEGRLLNVEDLDLDSLRKIIEEFHQVSPRQDHVHVAIHQAPHLHAVGGKRADIHDFADFSRNRGVSCRLITGVHKPLHTSLQTEIRRKFRRRLDSELFRRSKMRIFSTARGDLHRPGETASELAGQIDGEMRFSEAVSRLKDLRPDRYLIVGPGAKIAELLAHYNDVDPYRIRVLERTKQVRAAVAELTGQKLRSWQGVSRRIEQKASYTLLKKTLRGYRAACEEYILLEPGGRVSPLVDSLDRSGTLILFKGSFNPIHNGHVALFRSSQRRHPDAWGAFALSVHTHKSRRLDRKELLFRARLILKTGFPVVLSYTGYFRENVAWLCERAPYLRQVFIAGVDALSRLVDFYPKEKFAEYFSGVVFEYVNRKGYDDPFPKHRRQESYAGIRRLETDPESYNLSSSRIRYLADLRRFTEVGAKMPTQVAELFLQRRKWIFGG